VSEEPAPPRVRVVLINFDGGDVTLRCLDALRGTDYPPDRLEIVLVDNASVDGLVWVIRERYPDVRLIESLTNEGFARGNNLALRNLDGVDLVALLNNDTVPDAGWLRPLVAALEEDPGLGAACPKMVLRARAVGVELETETFSVPGQPDHGVQVTGVRVDGRDAWDDARFDERFLPQTETDDEQWPHSRWSTGRASLWFPVEDGPRPPRLLTVRLAAERPKAVTLRTGNNQQLVELDRTPRWVNVELLDEPFDVINNAGGGLYGGWFGGDRGYLQPDFGQFDEPCEVFSWCGGAVLLRREYLDQVGLFDPTFFLYYEDFDLSWRGRQLGWRYRYVPQSLIRHEHAYSSEEGSAFFRFWVDRNRRLALVKNAPPAVAARAVGGAVTNAGKDLARHVVTRARARRVPSPRWTARRVRQLASFGKALPMAVGQRRRLRRIRIVDDNAIATWTMTK
jgi:GT2 family glycosyltransferase